MSCCFFIIIIIQLGLKPKPNLGLEDPNNSRPNSNPYSSPIGTRPGPYHQPQAQLHDLPSPSRPSPSPVQQVSTSPRCMCPAKALYTCANAQHPCQSGAPSVSNQAIAQPTAPAPELPCSHCTSRHLQLFTSANSCPASTMLPLAPANTPRAALPFPTSKPAASLSLLSNPPVEQPKTFAA